MRFFSGQTNECTEGLRQCIYRMDMCKQRTPDRMYFCTRPNGHVGAHIACNLWGDEEIYDYGNHNLKVWEGNDVSDNYSRCTIPFGIGRVG